MNIIHHEAVNYAEIEHLTKIKCDLVLVADSPSVSIVPGILLDCLNSIF